MISCLHLFRLPFILFCKVPLSTVIPPAPLTDAEPTPPYNLTYCLSLHSTRCFLLHIHSFSLFATPYNAIMSLALSKNLAPQPITDIFTNDTNIVRRKCHRTVPMKVLALGVGRTGTACEYSNSKPGRICQGLNQNTISPS
jgi:hypothetical protein